MRLRRGLRVIDIGSGHAPLIRADVLCDRYPSETLQRPIPAIYIPLGRFVVGDIHNLPFRNRAFDFSYCCNVLEHLPNPEKACNEISRISSNGLIRTPSCLWETMGGSAAHLWLISIDDNKLIFRRKTLSDTILNSRIPEKIRNSKAYEDLFYKFYSDYFIDYYWKDFIQYEIAHNDDPNIYHFEDMDAYNISEEKILNQISTRKRLFRRIKAMIFESIRRLLGGKNIDLSEIVACPQCHNSFENNKHLSRFICNECKLEYPVIHGIPILLIESAMPIS